MSKKDTQKTKEKLQANRQNFHNLHAATNMMKEQFQRKLLKQISVLDAEEKLQMAKQTAKKKALALKGEIVQSYTDDDGSPEEVPVDGEVKAGTMVFMKNCASCHSLQAVDVREMKGPSLGTIYNRRAGSNTNFIGYSDAMLKATFFWSAKNFFKFMENPNSLVPKTTCGLKKHPIYSEEDRADLITLFKQFTGEMIFNVRLKEIKRVGYNAYQTSLYTQQAERERAELRKAKEKNVQKII